MLVLALLGGFFYGFSDFPPSTKTPLPKFQFDLDAGPALLTVLATEGATLLKYQLLLVSFALLFQENYDEFRLLASALDLCSPPPGPTTTAESFSCVNCLNWPQAKPLTIIRQWCEGLLLADSQRRVTLTKVSQIHMRETLPNSQVKLM